MIWALENYHAGSGAFKIVVCHDFKSVKDLLERWPKLEQTNYAGTLPGTTLAHAELYKEFFKLHDRLGFEMFWIDPLTSEAEKDYRHAIFSRVLQEADRALKNQLKAENKVADKWF